MRNDSLAELLQLILKYVGEECITVRREYGDDGGFAVIITIGAVNRPDKNG